MAERITVRESQEAFRDAIDKGFLSLNEDESIFAGKWMYMHTEDGVDAFKNITSRKYIHNKAPEVRIYGG